MTQNTDTIDHVVNLDIVNQLTPTNNATANYTLVLADADRKVIRMTSASANDVLIPTNASVTFNSNTVIDVLSEGAGVTTITGDTGVTINGVSAGTVTIQNQYGSARLLKTGTDIWEISGDLFSSGGGGTTYIQLQRQETSGTQGGTSTSGSWAKLTVNTELEDPGGDVSLASSVITIQAGTYRLRALQMHTRGAGFQIRFQNTSDATTAALGLTSYVGSSLDAGGVTYVGGRFTIASAKNFELQYRVLVTQATNGLGIANGWGTEVYCDIVLEKE